MQVRNPREIVKREVLRRLEAYLDATPDEGLIEEDSTIPIWSVLCDLFDVAADANNRMDYIVTIKDGAITAVRFDNVISNPTNQKHRMAKLFDEMKSLLD